MDTEDKQFLSDTESMLRVSLPGVLAGTIDRLFDLVRASDCERKRLEGVAFYQTDRANRLQTEIEMRPRVSREEIQTALRKVNPHLRQDLLDAYPDAILAAGRVPARASARAARKVLTRETANCVLDDWMERPDPDPKHARISFRPAGTELLEMLFDAGDIPASSPSPATPAIEDLPAVPATTEEREAVEGLEWFCRGTYPDGRPVYLNDACKQTLLSLARRALGMPADPDTESLKEDQRLLEIVEKREHSAMDFLKAQLATATARAEAAGQVIVLMKAWDDCGHHLDDKSKDTFKQLLAAEDAYAATQPTHDEKAPDR